MAETTRVDKDFVSARSDDWIRKVEQLYSWIKNTIGNEPGIVYKVDQAMTMREELMDKFGVPPKQVPILDVFVNNQLRATFKPVGLWVLGANGRIDVLTSRGSYTLVDMGSDDAYPDWRVFDPKNRKQGHELDRDFLQEILQ